MKFRIIFIFLIFFVLCACEKVNKEFEKKDNFPVHLQESAKDCGPVCLKIILDFYKKDISLDSIKKIASFDEFKGTSLLGLNEALLSVGLDNVGVKIPYELLFHKKLPSIVHWNNNHFIVLYKINKDSVWCVDPAKGKLKYSKEEFCKGWLSTEEKQSSRAGIALLLR